MKIRNVTSLLVLLLGVLLLGACGGGGDGGSKFGTGGGSSGGGSSGDSGGSSGGGATVVKIGNGTGANFVLGKLATTKTTLQSGSSATISTNLVDGSNAAVTESYSIGFTSDCLANGLANLSKNGNSVSEVSTSNGLATVNYTPLGCSGTDIVTATTTVGSTVLTATVSLTIEADQVLAVEFVSISQKQISLRGIGGQETSQVTFKLVGAQSAPIVGENVTFNLSTSEGGITLAPGTQTAVTDNAGMVTTVVQSGTTATTLKVIAVHDATNIQGSSSDIVISTGVAIDKNFSLSVSDWQPAGAFSVDGVSVTISVIASDQFGNSPPDGTQVRFVSPEAGKVGSACELIDGRCSVTWLSSATRPTDMRVQILAYMRGAETFTDKNGNSVYDDPSEFNLSTNDISEPFADHNENGIHDLGEFYVDSNQNGVFDSNGDSEWNGPCLSGVNPAAICSATDNVFVFRDLRIFMPKNAVNITSSGNFTSPIDVGAGVTMTGLSFDDDNGNPFPTGTKWEWKLSETNTQTLRMVSPTWIPAADSHILSGTTGTVKSNEYARNIRQVEFGIGLVGNASYTEDAVGELTLTITLPDSTKYELYYVVNYKKKAP
jgi:hypothetical protein